MQTTSLNKIINEIGTIAGFLWDRGWAERNAGNISVNITGLISSDEAEAFKYCSGGYFQSEYKNLSSKEILVTTSGSRMRDLAKDTWKHLCILRIDEEGRHYDKLSPDTQSEPTSELPTHLAVHDMLTRTGSSSNALLHSHVTELIALTHIKELCSTDALNQLLWSMHPEIKMFLPQGAGFIPYKESGSEEIARETLKILENHPAAIWEKHGVLATGSTVEDALDTIDLLAKAAKIYLLIRSKY